MAQFILRQNITRSASVQHKWKYHEAEIHTMLGGLWLMYNWVGARVVLQYLSVSSVIWWSASDNQTFGHLLKRAVMEIHLQPTALRCQGIAIISILLTNIWCVHLGTDPGHKSRFMHKQTAWEPFSHLPAFKRKIIHKLLVWFILNQYCGKECEVPS